MYSRHNPSPYGANRRYIHITTTFVGFHKYENAPEEVAFLKNNHRHKFYVNATIEVFHNDRELEFFLALDELERNIIPFVTTSYLGSCEQIAEDILWGLVNAYNDHRAYTVKVSEDNENGASIDFDPYGFTQKLDND